MTAIGAMSVIGLTQNSAAIMLCIASIFGNKLPPARREDEDVKEVRWMIEERTGCRIFPSASTTPLTTCPDIMRTRAFCATELIVEEAVMENDVLASPIRFDL